MSEKSSKLKWLRRRSRLRGAAPVQETPLRKRGVCTRVYTTAQSIPNAAIRKLARIRLNNGFEVSTFIGCDDAQLQEQSAVVVRAGRVKDLPGVRYHVEQVREKMSAATGKRRPVRTTDKEAISVSTETKVDIDINGVVQPNAANVAIENMVQVVIDSGIARYEESLVDAEDAGLWHGLVISESHKKMKELASVVTALSSSLKQIINDKAEDAKELLVLDAFKGLATNHVMSLHQFASKRDAFIKAHNFLDAKAFANLMGIRVNNLARKMQQFRENESILFVKMGDTYLYPEFQLDRQGGLFSELSNALPKMYSAGRSGWDICFWLFTEQSTLLKRGDTSLTLKDKSFDDMLELGKQAQTQATYHKGTPIDSLRKKESTIFTAQAEDWIAPDNREVNVRLKALG